MKIAVLNGSPKGATSVTMQYVRYLQKEFPQHELNILDVSSRIGKIEKDERAFQEITAEVRSSDGVLWAFPLYYMLVHSGYKRFIELIRERDATDAFRDKHAALLATSIHFFDHTAHNYMHGICDDLDMRYVGSFSADMPDLLKEKERSALRLFAEEFFDAIERGTRPQRTYAPVAWREFDYTPGRVEEKVDPGGKKILVVTDSEDGQTNLIRMVERFRSSFGGDIEVVNLHDVDIKGPCLGCIQCGYDNHCAYEGKDGYIDFYNTKVKTADIVVWAGTIRDRYLSSRWKLFLDRSFFNGHAPSLTGKQMGFIISGPLSQIQNLRQMLEGYVELQHANLGGFVTDEFGDSAGIDDSLQDLARRLTRFADTGYARPHTFLGVGGAMLFRDAIWGRLRFPFRADFVAYRKSGAFDFPQKDLKSRIQNALMLFLSRSPRFREKVNRRMKDEMVKPLRKFLED